MTSFQILRIPSFVEFVSVLCTQRNFRPQKSHLYANTSYHNLRFLRFCRTERAVCVRNGGNHCEKKFNYVRREAQAALLEYFHVTRNLHFLDAENMSKNSPRFLDKLLKGVGIDEDDDDVVHSLARFLRYHPINEFEPFFESIGLEPYEFKSFLPRYLMFLSDDELLLHNYHVLCNYGIASIWIGKIYKEATEIFRYDHGILHSKLESFRKLGLTKTLLAKIIASSPYLLRGDGNQEFIGFLEKLKNIGIEYDWLEEHISEGDSYNWKIMLGLMCRLCELGLTGKELGQVIRNHPDLLLEHSGHYTFHILVFLTKFGSRQSDLATLFLQFPPIPVVNFVNNLSQCYKFLVEINMSLQDIGRMFSQYPLLLGSCRLKKVISLRFLLNCGDDHLCQMVKDDPLVLKQWILGMDPREDPLLSSSGFIQESEKMDKTPHGNRVDLQERLKGKMESEYVKIKFLSSLGFVEESEEMKKVLKMFQGTGMALQESFECLVKAGLSREDVLEMLRVAPYIFHQSKGALERKINCIVKELGYPLSDVVKYPKLLGFKIQRIKLRFFMYEWLKNEGALNRRKSISSRMAPSDDIFVQTFVNSHPRGLEYWNRLIKRMEPKCTKTKFLLSLGFREESEEMEKVLKVCRGKGKALRERFDCLVKAGLSREDVIKMLKRDPDIFALSKHSIHRRIDCAVKELGYSVSDVVTFPDLLKFRPETMKLRLLMYELLKDEGALPQKLALSTLLACPTEIFVKRYVNCHPKGPRFWEWLKKNIYSS